MKSKLEIIAFYTLALVLGGCVVQSVHPLFTENELIFDANLVGTWSPPDSNETWQFTPNTATKDSKEYQLVSTESSGKKGPFLAGLGTIGQDRYLNIYPQKPDLPQNSDFYKSHLPTMNSFIKIKLIDQALTGQPMNYENVRKLLEEKPNLLKHEARGDELILTASTKKLQKFIRKYSSDAKLKIFGEAGEPLRRINPQELNESQNEEANQP